MLKWMSVSLWPTKIKTNPVVMQIRNWQIYLHQQWRRLCINWRASSIWSKILVVLGILVLQSKKEERTEAGLENAHEFCGLIFFTSLFKCDFQSSFYLMPKITTWVYYHLPPIIFMYMSYGILITLWSHLCNCNVIIGNLKLVRICKNTNLFV